MNNSEIIPAIAATSCTREYMKALKSSLCLAITERYGSSAQFHYAGRGARKHLLKVFESEGYRLATVLDPRMKLHPFNSKIPI